MKLLDLKELIKKSMLEVSPKGGATTLQEKDKVKLNLGLGAGNKYQYPNPREDEDIMPTDAMTPEELRHYEKMMGRDDVGEMTPEEEYEEERRAKLDTPSVVHGGITMREALNKDIKVFGQDLDKAFKAAGFDTLVLMRGPSAEQMNIVKTNPKAVLFLVTETRVTQTLIVYVNPKQIQKAESIINKFQLSDFDGPVLTRGWTAKQVQGAINPGDIVKQDADKARGMWYFYRLAKVDTKVKSMEEGTSDIPDDIRWSVSEVFERVDDYAVEVALEGYSPTTSKEYTAYTTAVEIGDGYEWDEVYDVEEVTMKEGSVILNRAEVYAKYAPLVKQYMASGLDKYAAISKAQNVLAKEYGATPLNIQSTISDYFDDQDRNATYANEDVLREADEIVAAWAEKQTLNEEMHGGYLELFEMNPNFKEGVSMLLTAWDEWKEGDETEPYMVEEAKQDVLAYLSSKMN